MRYLIPGNPVPLQRPRFNHNQRRPWDPQKTIKAQFAKYLTAQNRYKFFYAGPLELDITFYMQHRTRRGYHVATPDLSNLIKFVEDVAQGILYENDALIASISARKVYTDRPRTEFTIRELLQEEILDGK